VSLSLEGLLQEGAGDDLANPDGQLLEVVQGGAPGRAFGAPQLMHSVFRGALKGQADLLDQRLNVQGLHHREVLPGVAAEQGGCFLPPFYQPLSSPQTLSRAPGGPKGANSLATAARYRLG
jgi:hypothetical protein